ncbi:MAG: PAS domain S-box protein [Deltaproteobacteria bacterium]|nr:PAS domain S-box protein [Deltaproteobacteria bacterium]
MTVAKDSQNTMDKAFSSSKQLFRSILQAIPDLVSVVDRDFRVVFSNLRGEYEWINPKLLRKKPRPYCFDLYYPGRETQCDQCQVQEVFDTGKVVVTERYHPKAGYVEIHSFPIFDETGAVVMAGEYHRNINARRQAEDALREKNQVLEEIINASPLAIIALDHSINLTLWNPAAENMFGWKKEEIIGKPYPIVSADCHDELMENIRSLNEGEARRSMETHRMHKDGTLIDVSLSTAPMLNRDGVTIGYMAIMADIRERKQAQQALRESEANYRTIFDAANDATFVFDPENGDMLDVNRKMCEMYGYTRDEVLRLNVEDLSAGEPPYTYQDVMKMIWKTKYNKSHMFDWLAKDRDGRLFWVEVNMKGAIIRGEYRVLAVVRDITERKAAEEENRKMQERLRQMDKMAAIGTLASGIAHEINNPNNFILSNAQFISDIWPDIIRIMSHYAEENGEFYLGRLPFSEAQEFIPKLLDGLVEGSHRINGIVTGLKDFARQEKTRLDQNVDINRVIEASLTMLQNQIRKHTDRFQCILAENLPPVTGSFQQLEQVIVNLIMNALQSLPGRDSGAFISSSYVKSIDQIIIKVMDEGKGMPAEVQQAIFDPFFTTRLDSGGTGLGLSICFSIVKEHGGIIECESEPGRGSTFFVRLPVQQTAKKGASKS